MEFAVDRLPKMEYDKYIIDNKLISTERPIISTYDKFLIDNEQQI